MRISRFASILSLALASATISSSCALPLRPSKCSSNPAQQLLVEINAVRAREGVPPVWPNVLLAKAAQGHAQAIAEGKAEGHFGSDGSDPLVRITETGYLPTAFGENVAVGSTVPHLIVEAWMRSPTHRTIMLDPAVDEIGLGGVMTRDRPIWVADFGSTRERADTRCHPATIQ